MFVVRHRKTHTKQSVFAVRFEKVHDKGWRPLREGTGHRGWRWQTRIAVRPYENARQRCAFVVLSLKNALQRV
jgi:hypothetical protein